MPEEPPSPTLDRKLTTNIVAAYVRRNQIGADQLPVLISTVHQALATFGKPVPELDRERTPAVPIRRSVQRDYVVCLECGWRGHLATGHGLSVEQYRVRWTLPREHPITAPSYSERRSGLAKQIGLGRGRGRRASREEAESAAPETVPAPPTAISTTRKTAIGDDDYLTWGRDQIRPTIFRCASAIESMQREVIAKVALLIL